MASCLSKAERRPEKDSQPLARWWAIAGLTLFAATWKLWTPQTEFPQVPLFGWAGSLPLFVDWLAFGVLLGSLMVSAWRSNSRRSWLVFVASLSVLIVLDQHRLQPWAWQLLLMAICWSSADVGHVFNLPGRFNNWQVENRPHVLLTISIYFWSAISKFDANFYASHGQTLVESLFQSVSINAAGWPASVKWWLAFSLPLGELLVAVGLCWSRTRRVALVAATALHVGLILALGPMGLGHRPGVLLWNVAFIRHDWLLFGGRPSAVSNVTRSVSEGVTPFLAPSSAHSDVALSPQRGSNKPAQGNTLGTDSPKLFEALKGRDNEHQQSGFALSGLWSFFCSAPQGVALGWLIAARLGRNCEETTTNSACRASVFLILFACVWPLTARWGLCDHWLAWSVYSTQIERVSVTLTDEGVRRLPESARRLVVDGELWLDRWSLAALDVPVYPQQRFQLGVIEGLRQRCGTDNLVEVIVQHWPRDGGAFERLTVEQIGERRREFWINAQPRLLPIP